MFEPKLDAVMMQSKTLGERVRHMNEQEELLLRNVRCLTALAHLNRRPALT